MQNQVVTVRTLSSVVANVTTIVAVVDHAGPPARTFIFAQQVPADADQGAINNLERRAIMQAMDQFLLWVQNGKPSP